MLPSRHPLTLAFRDGPLERRFQRTYFRASVGAVRAAVLLAAFLYGIVFAATDALNAPHLLGLTLPIRGAVVVYSLGLYAFTFHRAFRRVWQPLLALLLTLAGWGLVAMLALDPRPTLANFFNGPVLVVLAAYVLFRLRFAYATAAGWAVATAFLWVAADVRGLPAGRVVSSGLFFASANLMGMFAAYALERYARRLFVQSEQLGARRREVAALLEARSRFFQDVSHELRTPLTLIVGPVARLLDGDALAPDVRAELDLVRRNAERLRRLVGGLLDLARAEAGHLPLRAAPRDAAAFVRGLVGTFRSLADERGVALAFTAAAEPLPAVFDADKLDAVVVNLVSNALTFTPPGGRVDVHVGADADRLTLDVTDTGAGIAAADLAHVFDRFRRARAAEGHAPGTGLGLSLVREFARLHGGDVAATSTVGQGSRFHVWIPRGEVAEGERGRGRGEEGTSASTVGQVGATTWELAPLPAPSAPFSPSPYPPPSSDLPVLLVVDDSPDVRAFVRRVLDGLGVIEEAEDGLDGLERARALVPDVVVTDVMMPGLDGIGLARALREDPALDHVPVVALTARAGEEARLEGFRAGVDDYLAKPFAPRELRARVENLLARQARLRVRFGGALAPVPGRAGAPEPIAASPVEVTSADAAFLARAHAAVEAALADDAFGVDAFADAVGLSRRQLERKLRVVAGVSPNEYVRLLRLSRAARLLDGGFGNVSEGAYAGGFPNPSYSARVFREHYGVAPSERARSENGPEGP